MKMKRFFSHFVKFMIFFQIELEQILGLNQDLAPASYENANTIPNNNSKLKVGEKKDKNHNFQKKKRKKDGDKTKLFLCANFTNHVDIVRG